MKPYTYKRHGMLPVQERAKKKFDEVNPPLSEYMQRERDRYARIREIEDVVIKELREYRNEMTDRPEFTEVQIQVIAARVARKILKK